MSKIKHCLNCGKEFLYRRSKNIRNYKYCSSKCYWEYHLKHYIKPVKK